MFESDDFDQVLSQFDLPELSTKAQSTKETEASICDGLKNLQKCPNANTSRSQDTISLKSKRNNDAQSPSPHLRNSGEDIEVISSRNLNGLCSAASIETPKHTKRKIINSFFDPKSKRKFPGPAGLLTGNLEEAKDETICHMELLSQDIEFTQNNLRRDLFESPLWMRLLEDLKSCELCEVDSIKAIKQQALTGNLRQKKAQAVTAFVETVDRSAIDPLIILRDTTGSIKCTLHRDAWSTFSPYIVSEFCALVLLKPTVLTTGSAFKKHYLNITLSNIYAIYSSAVLKEDEDTLLPDGYMRVSEVDFTVIKTEISPHNFGSNLVSTNRKEPNNEANDLLDGIDVSLFSDDLF